MAAAGAVVIRTTYPLAPKAERSHFQRSLVWSTVFCIILCSEIFLFGVEALKESKDATNSVPITRHRRSFPITTLINAKWEQTPLHLEIVEYLADENINLFWDFIGDVINLETHLSNYGK